MDKHTANSLIANSGIHFKTTQLEMNLEEPLLLPSEKTLKYTFLETIDFLNDCRIRFDVCSSKDGLFVPANYAITNDIADKSPNGTLILDETGIPRIKKDTVMAIIENYQPGASEIYSINSLNSYRIKTGTEIKPAIEFLLNKWLPMPMFEEEVSGQSCSYPNGWCRVKIMPTGEKQKNGAQQFRLIWAFDTKLADVNNESEENKEAMLRPTFFSGNTEKKVYSLCNRTDLLLGKFLNIPDGQNDAPICDYLVSLLGLDLSADTPNKYKFIGFYIYLINYIRLSGAAPQITLYNKVDTKIPVDMSVDIGNSRTCAVLFERGEFTKARMLRLRDLSEPWRSYENAFDMRVVFRRADFGGDITQDKDLFQWPSLIRVGEEAKHLVYRSMDNHGVSERTTNYSSPKRYLWDDKRYSKRWELMVIDDDPTNLKINPQIFIEGFTDHFDDDGTYLDEPKEIDLFSLGQMDDQCHYSRRSLMTFVMIEMLQQAYCYINSSKFRDMHGQIDCSRYLRNIIVTCPTAMPLEEQYVLRRAAQDATKLLRKLNPELPEMTITPDPEKLRPADDITEQQKRGWLYDEAFASQLVYLYAEISKRYNGKVDTFFKLKGHKRSDIEEMGFNGDSLTIGTIDIGAGTTDVMITAYGQKGIGRLTPIPLFYDSFYLAGDDILHNIIRDVILEGKNNESEVLGSINSALTNRILRMSPDELLTIPRIAETRIYSNEVEDIRHAMNEDEAKRMKHHLIQELMRHFFADDSANKSEKDRQVRIDFCTQVSHPISQFFLELLKQNRPSKMYSYDELFPKEKPADYLLEHFRNHFGFGFEELSWRYDPEVIGNIVKDTMEPLIKVLSVVMYAHNCDVLVLSGRPTNLEPLTKLFLKYIPIAPSRLVCLNQYRVGIWFPLATEEGYFQENQKAVVAVGAEVGYQASTTGFNGLILDFSAMGKCMKSTAKYIGYYDEEMQEVHDPYLTPEKGSAMLKGISVFPYFIGCKQFNTPKYQARPLYAIYNNSSSAQLNIMLQRNYHDDRETITVEDVTDMEGNTLDVHSVDLHLQTLAHDGNFWMDKGAFILKIQEN
jgi:hypothetical protein